ncbi:hypothetical protein X772_36550 [Mesorhizobium sp. LSJC280B00]|nr:hypothetical protein X772_36550 [Mesorhizobium sp. LSJC280B00]
MFSNIGSSPGRASNKGYADPTIADAVLDRLVHNAYRIELSGESMRKHKVLPVPDATPA